MNKENINIIIVLALTIHIIWGTLLILDNTAANVTSISSTLDIIRSEKLLGFTFLFAGLLAIISFKVKSSRAKLFLLIPQQIMLFASAYGAAEAILYSRFADGVVRSRYFIGADQVIHILISLLHLTGLYKIRSDNDAST